MTIKDNDSNNINNKFVLTESDKKYAKEVLCLIKEDYKVEQAKRLIGKKYGLSKGIRNSDILAVCSDEEKQIYGDLLIKRKTRTLSGVTPVAVMTKSDCPHGKCLYCPKGEEAAQSYTGKEPAALRAVHNKFDPYQQVKVRLNQYKELGHPTDKCELIIMGGTFLAQPEKYKLNFVKRCYDAFNDLESKDLETAKKLNETAQHRVIGLTIETRPDWAFEKHIDEMLTYGATRVEIGVQTLSDRVYKLVERGHNLEEVIKSTRLLKDSGFKICYHMMPGLFSTPNTDIDFIKQLFEDERFQPDMLKIYPTMVIKGTGLYKLWKKGKYEPYNTEQAADVISEAYRYIPKYVRVMRVQRDIPLHQITEGVEKSNLREIVEKKCMDKGIDIREIRHREHGLKNNKDELQPSNIKMSKIVYDASKGKEYFIYYEDINNDTVIGFIRLRIPYQPFRNEINNKTGIIRELHVYGTELNIDQKDNNQIQHKGYGRQLLKQAESIAKKEGMKEMAIISGIGVREYYRKHGYQLKGAYMWKNI